MHRSPRRTPGLRAAGVLATGVVTGAALSGCSSSPHAAGDPLLRQPVPSHVTVTTARLSGLGSVLTDAKGRALYMFPPDAGKRVSCTGACAGTWPPLAVHGSATAGPGVTASRLGTRPDPNTGARIVTYAGHPLYRYAGDLRAGTANGQALFNDGGPWYVLSPAGTPVTTDPDGAR